jgi:hypothetical protein
MVFQSGTHSTIANGSQPPWGTTQSCKTCTKASRTGNITGPNSVAFLSSSEKHESNVQPRDVFSGR